MNVLDHLTWSSLRRNRVRTAVTVIGVMLSAALFMAVTTAAYSLWDFMVRGYEYESGDYFVAFDHATDQQYAEAQADPAVDGVADLKVLGYTNLYDVVDPGGTYEIGAMGENFLGQMSVPLKEGRLPENSREILIPEIYLSLCRMEGREVPRVGDTLTLTLFSSLTEGEAGDDSHRPGEGAEVEYTVVGIMKDRNYRTDGAWGFCSMLTVADGGEGAALWHRLFLKTSPWEAEAVSRSPYGEAAVHTRLLNLYGLVGQQNTNRLILLMTVILLLTVMLASVSLISNVFAISVAERTKQFGLLSSVGATRRQIRACVQKESLFLMALGIPVGTLAGYGAVAAVLHLYGGHLARLFSFSADGGVKPYGVFSLLALALTVLIGALTVWISARIPAARAARIPPLEAIRQSRDYKTTPRKTRVHPLTAKLFGIPGLIGAKYYKVSRRKYRAIVIALAFSMTLFVFSAYYCSQLDMAADAEGTVDYDFLVSCSQEDRLEVFRQLREEDTIARSVLVTDMTMTGLIRPEALSEKYKEMKESSTSWRPVDYSGPLCAEQMLICFLEDDAFIAHLKREGIDPAPYLAEDRRMGVTVMQSYGGFAVQNEDGEWVEMRFYGHALAERSGTVFCVESGYPYGLVEQSTPSGSDGILSPTRMNRGVTPDGRILVTVGETSYIEEVTEEMTDGKNVVRYYPYDPATGVTGSEAVLTSASFAQRIEIGAQLKEVPYGIPTQNSGGILVVLPLSKLSAEMEEAYLTDLRLDAADYPALLARLREYGDGNLQFSFTDYKESQMNVRGIATLFRVFSTGFLVLISLIACANVLNTVSTNVALRRKDYGILRSMGFTQRHLYQMIVYECMNYGARAVLWSIPFSIGLCYGLYRVAGLRYLTDFAPPWDVFFAGAALILTVLLLSALYGMFSIRRDNPIDAIRTETA